tara:strand:+ start:3903 stop:5717 length:1815 start_codon:yes stop_codon:yes gene_type:complete
MHTAKVLIDELQAERQSLANAGHLHWFHWLIVIASALIAVAAWQFSKAQVDKNAQIEFERESTQVLELVRERMLRYEDALLSGVAAIEASGGDMSHDAWRTFATSLHIETKYPGINGIGVIRQFTPDEVVQHVREQRRTRTGYRVHPSHSRRDFMPIVYIEPELPNAKAVGLDMAHEDNRYTAALKARDTGKSQITGPIVLVQDEQQTPGFLFYAPYYESLLPDTVEQRREEFIGLVYAPFVINKLVAGTLQQERRRVSFTMLDSETVLYDENTADNAEFDRNPMFHDNVDLQLYGRTWHFEIQSTNSFRQATANNQPVFILIGGILIDGLLLTMFLMLTRASRRALSFADRMNDELQRKATELARSNADLESFAYVASHDLKTPLRGIADLAEYIEEDLQEHIEAPGSSPDIQKNLRRLRQQTQRMDNLINGILSYSSVGSRPEPIESIDVGAVLRAAAAELDLAPRQVVIEGSLPCFKSYKVRFEQVMNNLVGNAFKYNPDRERATIIVSCKSSGSFYEFSISDNGPGIEPRFHARIFEVFQTLQPKDEIESTGVGLSIVKRSVESLGGTICVSSVVGEGTTFSFTWPKQVISPPPALRATA